MTSSLKTYDLFKDNNNNPAIYLSSNSFITYESLHKICNAIIAQIHQKMTNDDLIVMIHLPQTEENLITCLATITEFTCFPVNPNLTKAELEDIFKTITPHVILTDHQSSDFIVNLTQNLPINIGIVNSNFQKHADQNKLPEIILDWIRDDQLPAQYNTNLKQVSLILSTSGTTGTPKLVGLSLDQLLLATKNINSTLKLTSEDTVLHALPLYHIGAFVDLLLVPLLSGGSIRVKKVTDTADIIDTICDDTYKDGSTNNLLKGSVTWYQCVPAMLSDLIRHTDDRLKGKLKFIRVVSSPLSESLMDEFISKFNVPLIPMYGMTETAGQITSWGLDKNQCRAGSVGKVSSLDVCIINEQGSVVSNSNQGEICVSGTQVIDNYLNSSSQTASHISVNGKTWFKTGDLGYIDEDGFLFITGRIKDQINRGGEKISIQRIDSIMHKHSIIAECAAFAIPHPSLGEEIALAVVPIIDTALLNKSATIKSIKDYSAKHLAHHQQPKAIYLVDALPKTASGKVQRHILAKQYATESTSSSEHLALENCKPNSEHHSDSHSKLIAELSDLWCHLLKVDSVQPEDNFFLLGGDSLLAVMLIDELISRYPALSTDWVINLYDYPTLNEFANQIYNELNTDTSLLDKEITNELININVAIEKVVSKGLRSFLSAWSGERIDSKGFVIGRNTNGTQTPYYWCVQSYEEFNNLVINIPSDMPIYGMRSLFKIQNPKDRDNDVLAQYYAQVIMALPTPEPYFLGGFCEGGTIMSLVAKYLTEQGKQVALLVVQDKFLQGEDLYADNTMLCWTNNLPKYDGLATYINNSNNPFSNYVREVGFTANFSISQHNFFFPEYKWLYQQTDNKHISLYNYDCTHSELNTINADEFVNDLIYEIHRIHNGLPSNHQLKKPKSLILLDPKLLSYNLTTEVAQVVNKKNKTIEIMVYFQNTSNEVIPPTHISGLTIAAKWLNHSGQFRQLAGVAVIETQILAKQKRLLKMHIMVPNKSGIKFYQLQVSLVQEGFYWFDEKGFATSTHRVAIY